MLVDYRNSAHCGGIIISTHKVNQYILNNDCVFKHTFGILMQLEAPGSLNREIYDGSDDDDDDDDGDNDVNNKQ